MSSSQQLPCLVSLVDADLVCACMLEEAISILTTLCVRMVCDCNEELVVDISTRLISTIAKRISQNLLGNGYCGIYRRKIG